mgnify:CR=1 FL=1
MSKISLLDMKGSSIGEVEISDTLLVSGKGDQAVQDVIVAERAAIRAGTASTLSKGQVAGSNKKPWQQKGTGRARAGLRQSPVWRGGGVAFGPHPRDYSLRVNRKVARLAFQRALSDRLFAGHVKILDDLTLAEPKTSALCTVLKALKIVGPVLLLVGKVSRNVALASRNVPKVEVVRASDASVYQLVRYPNIIIDRSGMEIIRERLQGNATTPETSTDAGMMKK